MLPLCHCPLPIQNHELSKSCAHLDFCMRLANGTSWPDAPRKAIAKLGEAENQGANPVAYRQPQLPIGNWGCL